MSTKQYWQGGKMFYLLNYATKELICWLYTVMTTKKVTSTSNLVV